MKHKLESRLMEEIPITSDDTTLMAENEEELKSLLMKEESEKSGLILSVQKTKIMVSSPIILQEFDMDEMNLKVHLLLEQKNPLPIFQLYCDHKLVP